jgi:hypothetical protein
MGVKMSRRTFACVLILSVWATPVAAAGDGKVRLPVSVWEQMLKEVEAAGEPDRPSVGVLAIERRIEGSLKKGLFSATLNARFEVLEQRAGHVRVPVLDGAASVGEVRLNGQRTSLLKEGRMYTVGVDKPGVYALQVRFFWGKEQDRFARRLRFELPEGGPTRLQILVPEVDIEARLAAGVFTGQTRQGSATLLVGQIDASGIVDLTWTRKVTHRATRTAQLEARLSALFTAQEAMMQGLASFDWTVLEGETDRVDLQLPPDIEIVNVEGEAVLQWYTEAKHGGRLVVLLRYLVDDHARLVVHFQYPVEAGKSVSLRLPLPLQGTALVGTLGVQGPAGLNVRVAEAKEVELIEVQDLPRELTDLTTSPILFGYTFANAPQVTVTIARHESVDLLSTLIDEVQASSVLIEDGAELTKLKLRLRNNTRQYLKIRLPKGALLTHSLIDGQAIRPASTTEAGEEALLFPLRQSERLGADGTRLHVVNGGETLSDIANFYYSDPGAWRSILDSNPGELGSERDLREGQSLRIPAKKGTVQETSFVIELAYKREHAALGGVGRERLALPSFDVDAMQVIWHLYLPEAVSPLTFSANLTQYSAIRYDPFRRARDFLMKALWIRDAWAGGKYESILLQRKGIYRAEANLKEEGRMVLASFPLVGERFRFKRVLLSRDAPWVAFTYVDRDAAPVVRWGALVIAFGMTLLLLARPRRRATAIAAGAVGLFLLVVAYYLLGVHRRMVWGADLALLVTLVWLNAAPIVNRARELATSPWSLVDLISLRLLGLGLALMFWLGLILFFPLLLSTLTLGVLLFVWWRVREKAGVAHV